MSRNYEQHPECFPAHDAFRRNGGTERRKAVPPPRRDLVHPCPCDPNGFFTGDGITHDWQVVEGYVTRCARCGMAQPRDPRNVFIEQVAACEFHEGDFHPAKEALNTLISAARQMVEAGRTKE